MSSDKPSTSEIIEELKSISTYLSESSQHRDDIPVLTVIADPLAPQDHEGIEAILDNDEIRNSSLDMISEEEEVGVEGSNNEFDYSEAAQDLSRLEDDDNSDTPIIEVIEIAGSQELADETPKPDSIEPIDETINDLEDPELSETLNPQHDDLLELKAAYEAELTQKVRDNTSEHLLQINHPDDTHSKNTQATVNNEQTNQNEPSPTTNDSQSTQDLASSLPEQKSDSQNQLFDESKLEPSKVTDRPTIKARGENPFLPPHIRKQLGKHKHVTAPKKELWPKGKLRADSKTLETKVEIQGDLLEGFSSEIRESGAEHQTLPNATDQANFDDIIEDLVKELLPKLEERLRQELAKTLATWNEHD